MAKRKYKRIRGRPTVAKEGWGRENCFRRDVIAVMARGSELGNACTYMRTFPWSLENDWLLKERLG